MLRPAALLLALAVPVTVVSVPLGATAQESRKLSRTQREAERRGIAAFAAGQYEEAVKIYSELYADFRDPIYLRNIGRCYQRLRDPDKAISSFEEYLSRGKRIAPAEREEIRGFIGEMETLKAQQKKPEPARAPEPTPPPPVVTAPPVTAPAPAVTAPAAPVRTAPPPSAGTRWLGWGAVGLAGALAIGGGVAMASAWSKHDEADGNCALKDRCDADASAIDSRSTLSKLLFAGAAVAGIAGGVLLYLDVRQSYGSEVTLGAGSRF